MFIFWRESREKSIGFVWSWTSKVKVMEEFWMELDKEGGIGCWKLDNFHERHMSVSSVSFLAFIYVFLKLLVPNGLSAMFLSRKNIKNINSFLSRVLYTLMLTTYIRYIWICSILVTLSGDIEKNQWPTLILVTSFLYVIGS